MHFLLLPIAMEEAVIRASIIMILVRLIVMMVICVDRMDITAVTTGMAIPVQQETIANRPIMADTIIEMLPNKSVSVSTIIMGAKTI